MTTSPTATTTLSVRSGSAGRWYVLEGRKVVARCTSAEAAAEELTFRLYGYDPDDGVSWYCDHDVPNGCAGCARSRAMSDAIDAMTPQERADWLYDGGTFETFFAPGGPAFARGL